MYQVLTTSLTARQAADEFAAKFQDEPRKVDPKSFYRPAGTPDGWTDCRFRLVGGTRQYRVTLMDRYDGWQIEPVVTAAE